MKILTVQNRMGIGDMIIFLPFIEAIAKKFNTQVYLLVKENSQSSEYLKNNKYIKDIIILDRDNKNKKGEHDGIKGSLRLIRNLRRFNFEKVFIFNSSLRYNLIAKFSSIKEVYQYPLFKKKNQHIIYAAQDFLRNKLNIKVDSNPNIFLDDQEVKNNRQKNFSNKCKNILLGIGGSGETKRIPAEIFLKFMELCEKNYKCKFFLATGKSEAEKKILDKILNTKFKSNCIRLDHLKISQTLPFIKNCDISICNDSSFSHLSAALGKQTLVLMADTPLLYGSYSPNMFPIIPEGVNNVSHNTLGKEKINPNDIFKKFKSLLD
tara:strand:+ start:616 stop:1578 length:963 start_codon:yes stop_codon:yes gene_type:complete